MYRQADGFTAVYRDFTMYVAQDFDEWRVILARPDVIVNGGRQFTELKAKECARTIADNYVKEVEKAEPPEVPPPEWLPLTQRRWFNWRP